MRSKVWSATCSFMQERWFYFYTTQPNPKYHCQTVKRRVQKYLCWALITTTNWWDSWIVKSYWRRSSFRYLRKRFLAYRSDDILTRTPKDMLTQTSLNVKKENKKLCNERIIETEHGSFIPLLMSAIGGMGQECKKFYSCLAETISSKRGTGYNIIVAWIRRMILFSFIR